MAFFILTDNKLHACDRALSIPRFDGIRGNTHFFAYGYAIRVVDRSSDVRRVGLSMRYGNRRCRIKKMLRSRRLFTKGINDWANSIFDIYFISLPGF
jgi:hypothetical protein